jgi:hypothetical protein
MTVMATTKNVTAMNGGKVHHPHAFVASHGEPFPGCRTGSMTNQGTRYRFTDQPVDCQNCLIYFANVIDQEPR